jgi:hypothetical protein
MDELKFNLLYRWFVGLGMDAAVLNATVFCKNRNRRLVGEVAGRFLGALLAAEVTLMRRSDRRRRITLGADKAYDATGFVTTCTSFRVTPQVARNNTEKRSNIAASIAASTGYATGQRASKRIEEVFAWVTTIDGQDKTRHRGLDRVGWHFKLALAIYNLIGIPRLLVTPA